MKHEAIIKINKDGKRIPFFFIHGAGMIWRRLNKLAAVIDKDQPLFLVQNYNAFVCKRENTEELAKRYFNLLTKKYPAKEYLIGGACYGAIISILLAKLLLDHGYKVRPLILVEAINLNDAEISAINSALNYRLSPQETLLWPVLREAYTTFDDSRIETIVRDGVIGMNELVNLKLPMADVDAYLIKCSKYLTTFQSMYPNNAILAASAELMHDSFYTTPDNRISQFVRELHVVNVNGDHWNLFTDENCKILANLIKDLSKK